MGAHVLVTCGSRQAVAYVTGELGIATAPRVRQALSGAIHRYERVTIDLKWLEFCDCAGLGALITAQKTAQRTGDRSGHPQHPVPPDTAAVPRSPHPAHRPAAAL
ncbi:STAS domain-containing protein [Streptomyces sp. NPDC126514]|uniref:STAS domain-containing protein n=1 Tax=Streptomyces sp. NPDC126514 TaxID=3155210 RepID=UPI0033239ADE